MQFSISCSRRRSEEVLKVSKRWLPLLNFGEFLNSNASCEIVDKCNRLGGRFLLVSPKRVVRFRRGFRCLVAYCGRKKSWKFQNVGCGILGIGITYVADCRVYENRPIQSSRTDYRSIPRENGMQQIEKGCTTVILTDEIDGSNQSTCYIKAIFF